MAVALSWLGVPECALGQESAAALMDEGVSLREQGRDAEALERFRRAHELSPSARALAQQGLAEQALGRWVDAHAHVSAALEDQSNPWIAQNRAALEGALERIREHIAHLEIVDGVAGAEVRVNGERAGVLPLSDPLTVPAGTVVLEIRAPGHVPFRRTIEVRGGGRARESVVLVPTGQPVDDASDAVPAARMERRDTGPAATGPDVPSIAGASVLGAAGLAGVVAAIVGMSATGCLAMEGSTCIEERTTNWVGVGLYGGVGLASVVGAVIWLAVAMSAGTPAAATETAVRLTPDGIAWSF